MSATYDQGGIVLIVILLLGMTELLLSISEVKEEISQIFVVYLF